MPEGTIKNTRIVISGIGPLTSIGFGSDELWKSLIAGKTGLIKEEVKIGNEVVEEFFIHRMNDFNIDDFGLDKKILNDIKQWKGEEGPTDLYQLMVAAKLASTDAGLEYIKERDRIGLFLTHENPGLDHFYSHIVDEFIRIGSQQNLQNNKSKFFREFFNRFEKVGYELQTFMFLFHISRILDIHGYSLFINNACASGLYALEAAADAIRSGKCHTAIVAGADYGSVFKHLWFKSVNVYPEDGLIRPFAKNCNGFVTGDAAAGLVLETFENARKRNANIYAEYLGGGFNLEGWKVTTPDITGDSYKKAIIQAFKRAKIKEDEVDLIIPHGVGMTVTDSYEAKSISSIFGKNTTKPLITALKPYIGHTLGVTTLIESIILLLSLKNNVVLPTLNSEDINPRHNIQLVKKKTDKDLKIAMKTACGFAGYNAAAIFRRLDP